MKIKSAIKDAFSIEQKNIATPTSGEPRLLVLSDSYTQYDPVRKMHLHQHTEYNEDGSIKNKSFGWLK